MQIQKSNRLASLNFKYLRNRSGRHQSTELHTFDGGSNFTSDVKLYQAALVNYGCRWRTAGINVDAMALASLKVDWDEKADKVMVLFSDAIPYRTGKIIDDVCARELLKAKKLTSSTLSLTVRTTRKSNVTDVLHIRMYALETPSLEIRIPSPAGGDRTI